MSRGYPVFVLSNSNVAGYYLQVEKSSNLFYDIFTTNIVFIGCMCPLIIAGFKTDHSASCSRKVSMDTNWPRWRVLIFGTIGEHKVESGLQENLTPYFNSAVFPLFLDKIYHLFSSGHHIETNAALSIINFIDPALLTQCHWASSGHL